MNPTIRDTGTTTVSSMVLRKRNRGQNERLVLHLSSPPPSYGPQSESDYEPDVIPHSPAASSSCGNSRKAPSGRNIYMCDFEGCTKGYTKPSRLAEHQRVHTGERPYVCDTCNKTYLRESHLQAHARSHLPSSSKQFVCEELECGKRFWTAQHLRVHTELHLGERPFKCMEFGCEAAFPKHHQLREHICSIHAPPGTKPYRCEHRGCTKSFTSNQKLRAHLKTHDEKRYTCVHQDCLTSTIHSLIYYPTWTALQHHVRTSHPPRCHHPSCNGKIFSAQRNLKAHLKLHEQRDHEAALNEEASDDDSERPRKKRRGGELGREWVCEFEGCDKDFKSKKALTNHVNVNHLGRRDFVCPHENCARAFGYKHLLQKHLAKLHSQEADGDRSAHDDETRHETPLVTDTPTASHVDDITGVTYAIRSRKQVTDAKCLTCPYPDLGAFGDLDESPQSGSSRGCDYVFSRAYDLRRHLKTAHGVTADKDRVDEWVQRKKHERAKTRT